MENNQRGGGDRQIERDREKERERERAGYSLVRMTMKSVIIQSNLTRSLTNFQSEVAVLQLN